MRKYDPDPWLGFPPVPLPIALAVEEIREFLSKIITEKCEIIAANRRFRYDDDQFHLGGYDISKAQGVSYHYMHSLLMEVQ